jgi:uncharacterized membrane protein YgaE (UPF0421/DUF939 family)
MRIKDIQKYNKEEKLELQKQIEALNKHIADMETVHKADITRLKDEFTKKEEDHAKRKLEVMRQVRERIASILTSASIERESLITEHRKKEAEIRMQIPLETGNSINVKLNPGPPQ